MKLSELLAAPDTTAQSPSSTAPSPSPSPSPSTATAPKKMKLSALLATPETSAPDIGGAVSKIAGQVGDATSGVAKTVGGLDSDVDYEVGAKPIAQMWLARSDNQKEALLALQHFYGQGNVGQDSKGRYWVKENGKKVSVYGGGQGIKTAFEKLGYDTMAYAPVLAGAATGAGAAAMYAPETGPVGTVAGAAVGAVAGSAINEFQKRLMNFYAKTPEEELHKLTGDAVFNGVLEGMGPAAKLIINPIKNGVKSFFGLTDRGVAMTKEIVGEGGKVPAKTGLPGATILQYHSAARDVIMGDPKEGPNIAYIRAHLAAALKDSGRSDAEVDSIMHEASAKEFAQSTTATGQKLSEKVSDYKTALQSEADAAVKTAKATVDNEVKNLTKISEVDPSGLGKDAADTIKRARQQFGTAMSRAYTAVDTMTGGRKIVDFVPIRDAANEALRSLPEIAQPPILKDLAERGGKSTDRDAPYSLLEAHTLRSQLRSMADTANMTRDPAAHFYGQVADTIDAAMTQAGKTLEETGEGNAAKALKGIDAQYRDGIAKYKDVTFRQMVRRAQTGIYPEPQTIVSQLVKPEEVQRLTTFMDMATPEVRAKVASADMRNMLSNIKGNDAAFLNEINARGKALDVVYGPEVAGRLRTSAKELAALGGKLPENMPLEPGAVADALKQQVAYTKMLDEFTSKNPVAALANPKTADRAVHIVTKPGQESATLAARDFYGANSEEWKSVQTEALKSLLARAIQKTPSLDSKIVGDAMKEQLGSYTKKQLDALFPGGLEDDLRTIADKANFLFPSADGEIVASLHGGIVKAGMPWTAPLYVYAKFWGWVADHPQWFYRLAGAAKQKDPSELKLMSKAIMSMAFKSAIAPQGPGSQKQ